MLCRLFDDTVFDLLPLTPTATGRQFDFNVQTNNGDGDNEEYGMIFTGNLVLAAGGNFDFRLNSDDGSQLYIDGELIVNHDGAHGASNVTTTNVALSSGTHDVRVFFYENGGGDSLDVEWTPTGTGGGFADLNLSMVAPLSCPADPKFQLDYGDAAPYGIAAHALTFDLDYALGSTLPDVEEASPANAAADGDDNVGDDEDADPVFTAFTIDSTGLYVVSVPVTNSGAASATLAGWIDFDDDGVFETDEFASATVANGATSVDLSFDLDAVTQVAGATFARFRIARDSTLSGTVFNLSSATATGVFPEGEVEDYPLTIFGPADYGDAPDTTAGNGAEDYSTLAANGGPEHGIISTLFLGSTAPDDDTDAFEDGTDNNGNATDDDNGGDEGVAQLLSAVTEFPALALGTSSYSINVDVFNNTGGNANLYAWIDFDKNGLFDEDELATGAAITVPTSGVSQVANILWSSFPGISGGGTYLRVRLTTDTPAAVGGGEDERSVGVLTDGEVEDYSITVSNDDYGDAPVSYTTLFADNGPRHDVSAANLFIGTTAPDGDTNGFGDGVDNNGDATDDDATFSADESIAELLSSGAANFPELSASESTYTLAVDVTNTSGAAATLHGWIDFDNDGTFDTDERTQISVPTATNDNTVSLVWTLPVGPSEVVVSDTFARFRIRLDSDASTSPSGPATSGEVEDYPFSIVDLDYGDAPDPSGSNTADDYSTLAANGGPAHIIVSTLFLGSTLADGDVDGFEDGVDNNGSATDDDAGGDEGISQLLTSGSSFPALDTGDASYSINVDVFNNTGANANLFAWIDFDSNGVFDEDELASSTTTVNSLAATQVKTINWTSLPGISAGTTYMRVRITSDTPVAVGGGADERSVGVLNGGEVEDYIITVGNLDYGDAPAPYNTLLADNGPRHSISDNLYLGDSETGNVINNILTDLDTDGYVDGIDDTGNAGDDDINDASNNADENLDDLINAGAAFPQLLTAATSYSFDINFNNQTGSAARIYAWIDFDQSGTFDVDEAIDGLFGQGDSQIANLTWSFIPNDIQAGLTYARFRISSTPLIAAGSGEDVRSLGFLSNGEIEDHAITIDGVDFGDAPSSYGTLLANSGARHEIGAGNVFIGSVVPDGDSNGFGNGIDGSGNATDDDTELTADEGISDLLNSGAASFPTLQATDLTYTLTVDVTNTTATDATLHGWIDFDDSGTFDADERTEIAVTNGTTDAPVSLAWTLPVGPGEVEISATFARFRIRLDTDASQRVGNGR